jgi:hypothetical protein
MGASAQTGIALLQSGEFWALTAVPNKKKLKTTQNSVRIGNGANIILLINSITPPLIFYYILSEFYAVNR